MIKVVIADDELTIRKGLAKIVPWEEKGYSVEYIAKNGKEVLDFFKNNYADIVISDIKMPLMDGLELQKRLNTMYPNLPFIFISGYEEFKYVQQAMKHGAFSYILKPIDIDELMKELDRAREKYCLDLGNIPLRNIISRNFFSFKDNWDFTNYEYLKEDYENNYFCIVNIRCHYNDMKSNLFLLVFKNKIKDLISNCFREENFTLIEASTHGIIFCMMNKDPQILKNNLTQMINFINKELEKISIAPFGIWIGSIYKGIHKLIESYIESFKDESFRFLSNINKPLTLDTQDFDIYNTLFSNEDKIIHMLMEGNIEEAKNKLNHQKLMIIEKKLSIEDARLFLRNILYKYIYHIKNSGQDVILPNNIDIYSLISFLTLDEMFKKSFDIIDEISHLIKPIYCNEISKKLEKAKRFIEEHYSDPYLSLNDIAEYVSLNPSYLTTEFTKYEGKRLINYITNIRIERAKYLLLNSSLKIADICNSVGYLNSTYFSTVFRRYTGFTPSEFRKNNM